MKLVMISNGALEIRWTWLPYWLAVSPTFHSSLDGIMRSAVLLNGLPPTEESEARISEYVIQLIEKYFPIPGLGGYLRALEAVQQN